MILIQLGLKTLIFLFILNYSFGQTKESSPVVEIYGTPQTFEPKPWKLNEFNEWVNADDILNDQFWLQCANVDGVDCVLFSVVNNKKQICECYIIEKKYWDEISTSRGVSSFLVPIYLTCQANIFKPKNSFGKFYKPLGNHKFTIYTNISKVDNYGRFHTSVFSYYIGDEFNITDIKEVKEQGVIDRVYYETSYEDLTNWLSSF